MGVGILVKEVGVGEEAGAEGGEESIAQKRDPGEQEADVAQSGDVADPGVPEEDGLDLGGFGIEEDEGDPKGDVEEEGLADRGAPFVEGDRFSRSDHRPPLPSVEPGPASRILTATFPLHSAAQFLPYQAVTQPKTLGSKARSKTNNFRVN